MAVIVQKAGEVDHTFHRGPQPEFEIEVLGQEYVHGPGGVLVPFGVPVQEADDGDRGFTVLRPTGWLGNQQSIPPDALSAYVHAWHDGFSGIGVRPI